MKGHRSGSVGLHWGGTVGVPPPTVQAGRHLCPLPCGSLVGARLWFCPRDSLWCECRATQASDRGDGVEWCTEGLGAPVRTSAIGSLSPSLDPWGLGCKRGFDPDLCTRIILSRKRTRGGRGRGMPASSPLCVHSHADLRCVCHSGPATLESWAGVFCGLVTPLHPV